MVKAFTILIFIIILKLFFFIQIFPMDGCVTVLSQFVINMQIYVEGY